MPQAADQAGRARERAGDLERVANARAVGRRLHRVGLEDGHEWPFDLEHERPACDQLADPAVIDPSIVGLDIDDTAIDERAV